ncbi:putative endo-polygalacturonase [Helianthus anomalus]
MHHIDAPLIPLGFHIIPLDPKSFEFVNQNFIFLFCSLVRIRLGSLRFQRVVVEWQLEPKTSSVEISQIVYENISGTSKIPNAIKFACSDTVTCTNIVLNNINIKRTNGKSAPTF